ncbi:MAG: carbamoyltransferase [Candidatus Aminicenantes bacterium]|nr:MAG: carbamoyltransferase [Candidatus Aminicenantes bacterium]
MIRNYLGMSLSSHDPAIAVVNSRGEVVFAEGTERYYQDKRGWNCVPDNLNLIYSLVKKYCDPGAQLVVSQSWSYGMSKILKAYLNTRLLASIPTRLKAFSSYEPDDERFGSDYFEILGKWLVIGLSANLRQAGNNISYLARLQFDYGGKPAIQRTILRRAYNHHLSHAAAACYSSPFDEAVCAVIDGYGEMSSMSFYGYQDGKITKVFTKRYPGLSAPPSIGIFYAILCWACGFDPLKGEEWKVMGLAPYGSFNREIYDLLRPVIKVKDLCLQAPRDAPARIGKLLRMRRPIGSSPLEGADIAYTGQLIFSEVCQEILNNLYNYGISENLILTGGCALNASWNGKILEKTPFKELYIFSAPGDDGNAIGAALLSYYQDTPPRSAPCVLQSPYLGSRMSELSLENLKKYSKLRITFLDSAKVPGVGAQLLADGKIIGWVQGRAEFGPRALGNRSILADPRRSDIKEVLNTSIKFREEFRPFAPSILHEYGPQYFENYQKSPYMERTLHFKDEIVEKVPGVVHVNRTGRLQTVERGMNERFYDLIAAFKRLTGIPLVLNTSFNIMGKPIIHSVEDAIAVFHTTGLDALIIENLLIEKSI